MTIEELKSYKKSINDFTSLELIEELELQVNEKEQCKTLIIIKNMESALLGYGDAVIKIAVLKEELQVRLER